MNNPIDELLKKIAENPLITLSGFILGVIGVVLAVIFYIKSVRYKSLRFELVSKTIIENLKANLDGLEVRFNNVPQERITITRMALWNAGNETITSSDLTEVSPLQISVADGAQVLDAKVLHETDKTNLCKVKEIIQPTQDNNVTAIRLSFDYIDQNEGCIIQIVHTGEFLHNIIVEGKLKGARPIRRLENPTLRLPWWAFPGPMKFLATSPAFSWVLVTTAIIVAIAGMIIPLLYPSSWYFIFLLPLGIWLTREIYTGFSVEQLPKSLNHLE